MPKTNPKFAFEHDIDISKIEIGLENFIKKINEKNEEYRNICTNVTHDVIQYEVREASKENPRIIILKLFHSYSTSGFHFLVQLIYGYCNGEVIARRYDTN
ncbi:hypothetical protein EV195_104151 [Tenacibaculum skagerrakense]|uniref:Uncharacterized protein n=1 Tax=Tenacibaculum skagerrakense TaxID=186571 RepID=A0A4R2NSZ6_9FLAO|nr:hypothetical protein [Tenacibaculum skagerrakense]TCP25119.1 hypothetical protein EV195_104151 [Tenacibaculum skagerrakense]